MDLKNQDNILGLKIFHGKNFIVKNQRHLLFLIKQRIILMLVKYQLKMKKIMN
ncbi:unnamed protein product [Paramecium sonneborni]|uniref:Uncharacterized protein n=1 Tax=Paramecium sonneborni TaxID=65129 RepID=A0A8S1KM46_9CILI|nr:unnamed protein product [Paramecium sonneborni]